MTRDLSKKQSVQVACGCGHVQRVERWQLIDEAARPEAVAELARHMPHPGNCSKCGAFLPNPDFFAVLRPFQGGTICFIFSATADTPGITLTELIEDSEGAQAIRLPFEAAPVVLARDLHADLDDRQTAIAEVGREFGSDTANSYSHLLENVSLTNTDRRAAVSVERLSGVNSADEFKEVLAQDPGLLSDEVQDFLHRLGSLESFQASIEVTATLLREARSDPDSAWTRYEKRVSADEPDGKRVGDTIALLEAMHAEERWIEMIATARPALQEAHRLGYGLFVTMIRHHLGVALLRGADSNRRADVEEGIEHLRLAVQEAPDQKARAKSLVNLAGAYGQRLDGDPNENFEEALRLLERAAEHLERESEPLEWSTLQTNLCRALQVRESGEKIANLERALQHSEAALDARSPERDAEAWALCQINLGVTLQMLFEENVCEAADARAAFERVLHEQARLSRTWLVAQTLAAVAELDRTEARRAWDAGDTAAQTTHLRLALQRLRAAIDLVDPIAHRLLYGRLLNHLSDVLDNLDDDRGAIETCEQALNVLTPQNAPSECQRVASRLGGLLIAATEWDRAADAYRQALAAAEITFHARLHTVGRQAEMRSQGNLARWAAYAVARAGNPEEAVQIIEGGRARELGRRISGTHVDPTALDGLPEQLQDAYLDAAGGFVSTELGGDSNASRAIQEALSEIRRQPGFENFAKAPNWEHITSAVELSWPLIYVNPTPNGLVLLCICVDAQGTVEVESIFRDTPQGTDVATEVLLGGTAQEGERHSYLGTASGIPPDRDLGIALKNLLPWLGSQFGSPISDYLRRVGASGVTLIPCGLIGLTPIHAGSWNCDGKQTALIEQFDVRYAASALMQVASLTRQVNADTGASHLVALGNPAGAGLESAEGEVEEIGKTFANATVDTAIGPEATSKFLLDHAAQASHLHLACHASGAAFAVDESSIELSDRKVAAKELAALGPLNARLIVVSACQTAVSDVADLPDEVVSISSVLAAAGSACVIASLWSVDDDATALLMTHLYEEMAAGHDPPAALRRAQLWLAGLDPIAEAEYLESHPQLRAAREDGRSSRHPAHWRNTTLGLGAAGNRFSHPVFWAPFIATGA